MVCYPLFRLYPNSGLFLVEFIEVNNKHRALEILCDVLHSKKHRTWQKKHEEIMIKYLELCVELKQSYVAKEGIYQYKIICQQSYISSFEDVIRKYIEMAEQKTNDAKEESQTNISEIDDLENAQTPEDILMGAVSNEGNQDRKDRVVLIPWVKFLWESYRQCLDLLRHNNKTERLYHDIAHMAFKFCIKYNRKSEFRKLCDHLHLHLDHLKRQQFQTPQQQQNAINLNSPESQAMQLETRLIQLDYAIQLELWQEAYKATDDIKKFNLMNLTKKGFGKPNLIASYYQKLALVFWKANSNLFHAAALFRLFQLSKDLRKNITSEDIQKMASRLVLATLSIPIPAIRPEIDKLVDTEENIIEQHHRNLSLLLGITSMPPTRASLIKDLKRMGVLQFSSQPIQDLYQLLEIEFNPLGICGRVQQIIDYIEQATADGETATESMDLRQYIGALKEVTIVRLIREVSQVYRTIEFNRLLELCPFADSLYMEKLVVESARRHDLQVLIDHRRGCYIFGTELRVSTSDEFIEGPHLQTMPNEQMRRQLVSMYSSLQKALNLIEPDLIRQQREEYKRNVMKAYFVTAKDEHLRVLDRQNIVEKRKEMIDQLGKNREMEEKKRLEEEEAKRREAEAIRMMEENKERERLKREKDELELRKQMTIDQLKKMKDALPDLDLDDMDDEELAKLRPQDLHMKRVEQLEKERREQLNKQKKLERKIDHFERAKRVEEIPLLQKQYEELRVVDRQIWDQCEQIRIETIKEERLLALKERDRFQRVQHDKEEFTHRVIDTRQSEFQEKKAEFEKIVESEREKRLAARREERIEKRRVAYRKERQQKLLQRQEEIQRKRLKEIEERDRVRRETRDTDKPAAPLVKEPEAENSWRRGPASNPVPPEPSNDAEKRGDRFGSGPRPFSQMPAARREPISVADKETNWRTNPSEARPEPSREPRMREGDRDGAFPRRAYGGRFSDGRARDRDERRFEDRDQPRMGPSRYVGSSESDSSRMMRRDGPPMGQARDGPFGQSRDRERDRDRGFPRRPQTGRGPSQFSSADIDDSWRSAGLPAPYGGRSSDRGRREPLPAAAQAEPEATEDDGEGGWMRVDHGRKGPMDRRERAAPMSERPRYGGRDSYHRDRRN